MKTPEELTDVLLTTLKAAPDDRTPAFLCIMVEKFIADVQAGALSAGKKAGAAAERERCVATLKLMARVHSQRPGHADRVLNDAISLILSPTNEDTHD